MKSDPVKLRALLDDVLPTSSEHCGPTGAEVLSMLRHERQCHRRLRRDAALVATIVLAAGTVLWHHHQADVTPVVQTTVKPVYMIHHVNDEQLFALLEGMPAALMEMPNGNSTLLLIEP